ncbi:PREDICTED: basic salivary proline-rich protein 1-like [Cercocebus atys]|uniref:basic salivary proline-rich protein 1-like n=1 Tax=Cercocebus atys TaxID=9531 RepID=UPI0005F47066|nr:PREDICTED: basic salivary proline-rich protein 1-like [Cercocebus atys]
MRPGERGRQPQTERGSGGGPSPSAEAGASQSRCRRVPGCASGERAPGPDQDGKEKHSRSQGLLEFLGVVFGPPGSAGHSAPTPPESALPEAPAAQRAVTQRRSRPGKSKGDPRLPLRWAARDTRAAGRHGTAPRSPGPAAPAPSARARGARAVSAATSCAQRALPACPGPERGGSGHRPQGCWRPGRRPRRQKARALRGAPTRALRPPPPASRSYFSFSSPVRPALLLGPSMTHRSPRVPPSLFHFPLRNVTLPPPRLPVSSPFASRQGAWGGRTKGFGIRVYVTEFPITHSFGLFPDAEQLRLPPSNRRAPGPSGRGRRRRVWLSSRRAWESSTVSESTWGAAGQDKSQPHQFPVAAAARRPALQFLKDERKRSP